MYSGFYRNPRLDEYTIGLYDEQKLIWLSQSSTITRCVKTPHSDQVFCIKTLSPTLVMYRCERPPHLLRGYDQILSGAAHFALQRNWAWPVCSQLALLYVLHLNGSWNEWWSEKASWNDDAARELRPERTSLSSLPQSWLGGLLERAKLPAHHWLHLAPHLSPEGRWAAQTVMWAHSFASVSLCERFNLKACCCPFCLMFWIGLCYYNVWMIQFLRWRSPCCQLWGPQSTPLYPPAPHPTTPPHLLQPPTVGFPLTPQSCPPTDFTWRWKCHRILKFFSMGPCFEPWSPSRSSSIEL